MIRRLIVILVAICCISGCAAFHPFSFLHQSHTDNVPLMVSLRHGEIEFNILPIGSYVSLEVNNGCKYQGTIVHRNASRLELANCLRMTIVDSDAGQPQLMTECVPLQVVENPAVTDLSIMSLPSPKFDPPEMKFERDDMEVVAIEFHSGRVQRWIEPQVEAGFNPADGSAEDQIQAMKSIQAGSQISFIDLSGQRYNALLLSATPQKVNLRCCVKRDVISGCDGHEDVCVSILPVCSRSIESISSFEVVAPPPLDFDASEFDSGCELCIADAIYKSGRRQSQWKLARDDVQMSAFFEKKARPVMERNLQLLN